MIYVLAVITAKPGMRDSILKEVRAILPIVRTENGCLEYGPATDADGFDHMQTVLGSDTFVSVEKWANAEVLKAHAATAHMAAYAAKTKELIASRVLHVLTTE